MLIHLQVVRTPSLGSTLREFSSLPRPYPSECSLNPLKETSTASTEEFYYRFYHNEGLENKPARAPLLRLAKSLYY